MALDKGLLETAYANLENSISEYNGRYGYLGANWERCVQERYDERSWVSFRVYFDGDYCYDAHFADGQWSPETYLWLIAEESLEFAIADDRIEDPLPRFIEITF